MKKSFVLIAGLLAIVLLLLISFWFHKHAYQIEGATRMIAGPQDTIYVLVNDSLLKLTPTGDVLKTFDLSSDLNIEEPVADFYIDANEDILIGLKNSQIIKIFSAEGRLKRVHSRAPSLSVNGEHNFKFTKDPVSGTLYVADSLHHRIQIYGADEKEIRTLEAPVRGIVHRTEKNSGVHDEEGIVYENDNPEKRFLFPNALAVDGDKLYVTDTDNWRIVVFNLDGSFDRLIPIVTPGEERDRLPYPVRFARMGNTLIVLKRGARFVDGEVLAVNLVTGEKKLLLLYNQNNDPQDVVVHNNEVLISDRASMKIFRVGTNGEMLGTFGMSSFQNVLSSSHFKKSTYLLISKGSLWGILVIFIILTILAVKDLMRRNEISTNVETNPIATIQKILGPRNCKRRKILLVMLPGLGQLAAGRVAQALIFPLPLCVFSYVFLYFVSEMLKGGVYLFPAVMAFGLIVAGLWAAIVVNGIRLNEPETIPRTNFSMKALGRTIIIPVLTIVLGALSQHIWELIKIKNPEISIAFHTFFRENIGLSSSNAVFFPAPTPVSRLFAWGGAVATIFAATAWLYGLGKVKIIRASVVGFFSGMLSWSITATLVGTMLGSAYFMPISQGLLVSYALYSFFSTEGMSALIIPFAIVGAWIGGMIEVLTPTLWFISMYSGEYARIKSVVCPAYFIHLAAIITMNRLSTKKKEANANGMKMA